MLLRYGDAKEKLTQRSQRFVGLCLPVVGGARETITIHDAWLPVGPRGFSEQQHSHLNCPSSSSQPRGHRVCFIISSQRTVPDNRNCIPGLTSWSLALNTATRWPSARCQDQHESNDLLGILAHSAHKLVALALRRRISCFYGYDCIPESHYITVISHCIRTLETKSNNISNSPVMTPKPYTG